MVKTSRYTSCVPEWTKLPQYKDQPFKSNGIKDVEMEGIEVAVEQKLVQPEGSKRKRTRADSAFGTIDKMSTKRVKVPELTRVQSEQFPAFSGMITILVKDKKKRRGPLPLQIDTDRASSRFIARTLMSDFFSDWNTTLPKPVDLTSEDPSLVKHYVEWVNTRKITTRKRPRWASQQEKSRPDYKEEMTFDTEQLALCYGLGERLEDMKYRNALLCVIRYYVVKEGLFPGGRAVAIIYEHTSRGSPARKMMVDFWAYAGNLSWLENNSIRPAVCPEFFEDLFPALLRVRTKPGRETWPWADNADAYLIADGETRHEETSSHEGDSMEL